jgi:hypothetical protein
MRHDPRPTRPRQRRPSTTALAALLIVALTLVTPAAGPSRGAAHDFVSVHLIFPHHHDAHAGHAAVAADDRAEDDLLTWLRQPALSAAGRLTDAASLAGKGLVMAAVLFMASSRFLRLDGGMRVPAPRQWRDPVPTRPPR